MAALLQIMDSLVRFMHMVIISAAALIALLLIPPAGFLLLLYLRGVIVEPME